MIPKGYQLGCKAIMAEGTGPPGKRSAPGLTGAAASFRTNRREKNHSKCAQCQSRKCLIETKIAEFVHRQRAARRYRRSRHRGGGEKATVSNTREIPLSQGKVAIVDAQDFERLARFKWFANRNSGIFYARRTISINGRKTVILMHRYILGLKPGDLQVDHRDGDGLNNTRANLRLATRSENQRNCGKRSKNTSGYKGVSKRRQTWMVQIGLHGKKYHLGAFSSPIDAAFVYDAAALKMHGEFARTNFFNGSAK